MFNPILANAFFWRFLSQFLAVLCICAGIVTFGNDPWFDRLFEVCLILTAIFCRQNVNVVMLVIIVLVGRTVEELLFLIDNTLDEIWLKCFLYSGFMFLSWLFRHDVENKYLFPTITLLSVFSEIYWFQSHYQAPQIVWYLIPYSINLVVRYAIFMRYELVEHFFPSKEALCFSEFKVRNAHQWGIYAYSAIILEYLLRHIFHFNVSIVYESFSYFIQAISTYVLWCILQENIIWLRERNISA